MRSLLLTGLLLLILNLSGFSQNIIQLDDSFKIEGSGNVNYGEQILLLGKVKPEVKELSIIIYDGQNLKRDKISIQDERWTYTIGPFLPNTSFSILFETTEYIGEQLEKDISKAIKKSLEEMQSEFIKADKTFEDEELMDFARNTIEKHLPSALKKYKNEYSISAFQFIVNSLTDSPERIRNFYNKISELRHLEQNITKDFNQIQSIINSAGEKNVDADTYQSLKSVFNNKNNFLSIEENRNEQIKSTLLSYDSTLQTRAEELFNNKNKYGSIQREIETISGELTEKAQSFVAHQFPAIEPFSKKIDSELLQYAGFDASGLVFSRAGLSIAGMFFTVSPYFEKINPEKEINWRKPWTYITPTFGIAITTTKTAIDIEPLFYAGLSLRINRLFRLTSGDAFYIDGSQIYHYWTSGISLNINYLAEALNIFNSASTIKSNLKIQDN